MTLIVATIGPRYCTLLADRRLTSNGTLFDDDYGKAGHLLSADATMLFAFTGVAKADTFETSKWITETIVELADAGIIDHLQLLHNLADRATERFDQAPLSRLRDRRLSIVFAGFMGNGDPAFALVSNFETVADDSPPQPTAAQRFVCSYIRATKQVDAASAVFVYGNYAALKVSELQRIAELRLAGRPLRAIRGTSVALLHELADSSISKGTIGKKYLFATLAAPVGGQPSAPSSYYGSDVETDTIHGLDVVQVMPFGALAVRNVSVKVNEAVARYPKQPRNAPCACGSGRKYKHCHGSSGG